MNGGERGAHDGLVDRQVDQLGQWHLLVFSQVFANSVGNNHGFVERQADKGQHGRDRCQVELQPGYREQADGHDDIVRGRGDGGERELPLEADPHIDQDGAQRDEDGDGALPGQFTRHRAADGFGAADFVVLGRQGIADLGHRRLLAACRRPRCAWMRTRTSSGVPKPCTCTSPRSSASSNVADLAGIGGAADMLDFDGRAADEVDAEIEALEDGRADGQHRHDDREDDHIARDLHERDLGAVRDEAEMLDLERLGPARRGTRCRRSRASPCRR